MKKGEDYTGVALVFLCHDGQGNYLLSKRTDQCRDEHSTWDPGGGAVEFNDNVTERLKQEIKEEYCTDVIYFEFLGYRDVHRYNQEKPTHWIALDFKVLVDKTKVRNGEPHKLEKIEWFKLNSLPFPLHSQFPYFLAKYKIA